MSEQLSFLDATTARDAALTTVSANAGSWMEEALEAVRHSPLLTATGEDIRLYVEKRIGPPHHHNAYGALIMNAVRRGYIVPTGRYLKMRTPKSHGRKTPEYRRA